MTPQQRNALTVISAGKVATVMEVFVVLLSEYEQFVEPFQNWELN